MFFKRVKWIAQAPPTLPKISMEPENGPLEEEIPFRNHNFQVLYSFFGGVFYFFNLTLVCCKDFPCFQSLLKANARQEVELTSTSAQAVTTKHEVQVVPERIFVAKNQGARTGVPRTYVYPWY